MSTRGAHLQGFSRFIILWLLLYRCTVFSLVPIPHNNPINDTVELEIHHSKDCPTGYYTVKKAQPCKLCSLCRSGEMEVHKCTPEQNTVCHCGDGLVYSDIVKNCIPPIGVSSNWTSDDFIQWQQRESSSLRPAPSREMTTKISKMQSSHTQDEEDVKAQHATKPDWTDFYILTVSSTAVLFFTLSLVLLFLMAVMKARSWYLYRRLPGSGVTLCFRGWMSRVLRRILPRQRDRSTEPIEVIAGMNELSSTKKPEPNHQLKNSEVVEYLHEINAVICCADLHFTFPQKKTYISSCITSEADVIETRSKGSPNFILQACHNTVNVVLGHNSHKCCRHRNMLTLNSNQSCDLGYFEAATMEVQERSESREKSLNEESQDSSCQHQQRAGINPCDILNLYTEIATPFKDSHDLIFKGSLQLYLRKSSSHRGHVKEKVKLKYKEDFEYPKDSEECEALLKCGISDVRYLYSLSERECIPNTEECIPEDEAVSESSVEVVVDVHDDDRKTIAVTSV